MMRPSNMHFGWACYHLRVPSFQTIDNCDAMHLIFLVAMKTRLAKYRTPFFDNKLLKKSRFAATKDRRVFRVC